MCTNNITYIQRPNTRYTNIYIGRCKNGRCGKDFPKKVKTTHCLLHICLDVYVYGYTIVISVRIRTVGMCTRSFCVCILINSGKILFFLSQPLNVERLSKACNLGIGAPCGGDMINIYFLFFFFLKINISGTIHKEYLICKCVSDVVLLMLKTAIHENGKKLISYLVLNTICPLPCLPPPHI